MLGTIRGLDYVGDIRGTDYDGDIRGTDYDGDIRGTDYVGDIRGTMLGTSGAGTGYGCTDYVGDIRGIHQYCAKSWLESMVVSLPSVWNYELSSSMWLAKLCVWGKKGKTLGGKKVINGMVTC